ncbi:GGDEF domain-containing protein [Hydrogenimonas sp.]
MSTYRRLFIFITTLLSLLTLAIIVNTVYNFRDFSFERSIKHSENIAQIVRDGLTAHMINNIMDKRAYFLRKISETKGVEKLWIVRGESVNRQYGKGLENELPQDEIDKKVLSSGKPYSKLRENAEKALIRVTIPYKATPYGEPNCLSCHQVKAGETLGAISLELDISDVRQQGIMTILKIAGITIVFILIAMIAVRMNFKPYLEFFNDLRDSLIHARRGDFSHKIHTAVTAPDIRSIAELYNQLIEKFEKTVGIIDKKLAALVKSGEPECSDPLEKSAETIQMLADIHHFKKTIELDESMALIYERLGRIVEKVMGAQYYVIFAVRKSGNTREVVCKTVEAIPCSASSMTNATECRAFRTMDIVESEQFPNLCTAYEGDFSNYFCIPYAITDDFALVIMLLSDNSGDISVFQKRSASLEYYLENAKPVIQGKLLMEKLREKSLKDGLTGLYNRKFLEEFIDTINRQSDRSETRYAALMLDIDFFKKVNDTYGHDVGDKFIKLLSRTILENIRKGDIAARYGGEEFVVLLHNSTKDGAVKVAERIRKEFSEKTVHLQGENIKKTVSIGVAFMPEQAKTMREAIKYADVALYKAKESGRNKVVVFDPDMFEHKEY